jgi:uncharacterized protein (DUF1778 family)
VFFWYGGVIGYRSVTQLIEGAIPVARHRSSKSLKDPGKTTNPLTIRLDPESKALLTRAAKLRGITVSDYVRTVTLPQARREIHAAREGTIALSAEEQLAFWKVAETARLTVAQRCLASIMRGES